MSEFNVDDKVYLECKVRVKDKSDDTYRLEYEDWEGEHSLTYSVEDKVLHPTDESYNKGLNDAWELAKKIVSPEDKGGYTWNEYENIFGKNTFVSVFANFTPQQALAKAKPYEDECNKIKVGDVVNANCGFIESIVTKVDGHIIFRLFKDGSCTCGTNKEDLKKTGKHFDSIDEFMKS